MSFTQRVGTDSKGLKTDDMRDVRDSNNRKMETVA